MPKLWSLPPPKKTHWLSFGYKTSVHFPMVHNMHSTHSIYLQAAVKWSLLNNIQKWHLWSRGLNTLWGHPTLRLLRNSVLHVPSAALESLGVLNSRIWRDGPCKNRHNAVGTAANSLHLFYLIIIILLLKWLKIWLQMKYQPQGS